MTIAATTIRQVAEISTTGEQAGRLDQEDEDQDRVVDRERQSRIDKIATHLLAHAKEQPRGDRTAHASWAADDDDDQRLRV